MNEARYVLVPSVGTEAQITIKRLNSRDQHLSNIYWNKRKCLKSKRVLGLEHQHGRRFIV